MGNIIIVRDNIEIEILKKMAQETFGDMVKAVADILNGIVAIGGELHADAEALLLEDGSKQQDLWGFNIYPEKSKDEWLEYDSMINIKPGLGNRSRNIENDDIRKKIAEMVLKIVK
jgi:hypothetical protein